MVCNKCHSLRIIRKFRRLVILPVHSFICRLHSLVTRFRPHKSNIDWQLKLLFRSFCGRPSYYSLKFKLKRNAHSIKRSILLKLKRHKYTFRWWSFIYLGLKPLICNVNMLGSLLESVYTVNERLQANTPI